MISLIEKNFGKRTKVIHKHFEELSNFIKSKRPNVDIAVQDDSIRITPR
jgi:hypothetical protein